MTIVGVDVLWGLMLLGIGLFATCCLVFNPVLTSVRVMALGLAYAVFAYMAVALTWRVALATWCVFAASGGAIALAYEAWARRRWADTRRPRRPLVMIRGVLLWPTMIPDALEGMLVDLRVLQPSRPEDAWRQGDDPSRRRIVRFR